VLRQRIAGVLSACALTGLFIFYSISAWQGSGNQTPSPYATHNSQNPSHQQIDESSGWYWLTHDAAGFFTLGLVFVGLGQAGLFFWQLRLMREGLRDTKEAADAAKETAEATTASVSLSRETAKRQLRAYIHIDTVTISLIQTEYDPNIDILVKNFGATPAYCITNKSVCAPFISGWTDFELKKWSTGEIEVLGPTQQAHSTFLTQGGSGTVSLLLL
jgi:hypothetical protein